MNDDLVFQAVCSKANRWGVIVKLLAKQRNARNNGTRIGVTSQNALKKYYLREVLPLFQNRKIISEREKVIGQIIESDNEFLEKHKNHDLGDEVGLCNLFTQEAKDFPSPPVSSVSFSQTPINYTIDQNG